jgi:hypothetical protein
MSAPVRSRAGAVDPRLLQNARATRPFLVALVVLGVVTALARALLAPPLLVVNEPGEHLDTPTVDALTADLLDTVEGREECC